MKYTDALNLKPGDLVTVTATRNPRFGGLVLEVESIEDEDRWCRRVTMKQPGFDAGFRLRDYDSRLINRFEA